MRNSRKVWKVSDIGLTDVVVLWEVTIWEQGKCVGQNHGELVKSTCPLWARACCEAVVAMMAGGAGLHFQILNSLLKSTTETNSLRIILCVCWREVLLIEVWLKCYCTNSCLPWSMACLWGIRNCSFTIYCIFLRLSKYCILVNLFIHNISQIHLFKDYSSRDQGLSL